MKDVMIPVMLTIGCWSAHAASGADRLLVEAESFQHHGGWVLDTQFIPVMGSPYLLAHGLGQPVDDATTQVTLPNPGVYRVFVRTKDWVARWEVPGQPGRFQLLVNGQPLEETFGTRGTDWFWHDGGTVRIDGPQVTLALRDLTGFAGRCDAIFFTRDLHELPPDNASALSPWRRALLGLPDEPADQRGYDLVVVGGGYAGIAAAVSAARMGCRVALLQNRPVLGGNGSSEVRVWAQGLIRRGRFPRVGEIVEEFADSATKSPGQAEEFGDAIKEAVVRAEPNIDLFLHCHADRVDVEANRIAAVYAFDTRSSERFRFTGHVYADCTGHGTIGHLAGAHWEMTPRQRMGMSNMWLWEEADHPVPFPETPWALDLNVNDFPYPRDFHGQWFWESGFDQDPIRDAEAIRDWNLRAVFGAFNALKNRDGRDQHRNARLAWVALIGGPRESRRLLGDVILTQEDVVEVRDFPDGIVPTTWSIDLHYPKEQYAHTYPDNPFISRAEFDDRVDKTSGYPIPYRCFYSRNIDNLFMAGRCISVTHEALGTVRVMKTGGMMGEVVGKAASLCALHACRPRDVYTHYLEDLKTLCRLPGQARRTTVTSPLQIPEQVSIARPEGPPTGIDPEQLPGVAMDDVQANRTGSWSGGAGLPGYVGYGYLYAGPDSGASIEFRVTVPEAGRYDVRIAYRHHENRGSRVPVHVQAGSLEKTLRVDMREPAPLEHGFQSLGTFPFQAGDVCRVVIATEDAGGLACADAVQLVAPLTSPHE